MNLLLCDIDHTIADAAWRDDMFDAAGEIGWDEYHKASMGDDAIKPIAELCKTLYGAGWQIIFVTTRPEKWRLLTMQWLTAEGIEGCDLLMRAEDDWSTAPEQKVATVLDYVSKYKPDSVIVIDSRDDVVSAFKAAGIVCLQSHAGKK